MAQDEIPSSQRQGSRRRWRGSKLVGSARSSSVALSFVRDSVPSQLAFVLATKRLATKIHF